MRLRVSDVDLILMTLAEVAEELDALREVLEKWRDERALKFASEELDDVRKRLDYVRILVEKLCRPED